MVPLPVAAITCRQTELGGDWCSPRGMCSVRLGSREGSAGASPFRVPPRKCPCLAGLGIPPCPLKAKQKSVSCLCQHGSPHLTRLNARWDLQQIPAEALTNSVNIVFQGNQCSLSQLNGKRLTAQGTLLVSSLEQAAVLV